MKMKKCRCITILRDYKFEINKVRDNLDIVKVSLTYNKLTNCIIL